MAKSTVLAAPAAESAAAFPEFNVSLGVFDGPFDLLLNLIGKHKLDITEVALSAVTDEFIAYVAQLEEGSVAGLNRASEFLVVAATLLDLKIASLLPQGEAVDSEDIALLEARDLLFARLLQYRAFKQAAAWFSSQLQQEQQRFARRVELEDKFRRSAPNLKWVTSSADLAALAALALTPQDIPTVGLSHLHAPVVSIREQAALVVSILRSEEQITFRQLIAGVSEKNVIVARFLAILELYRRAAVNFEQAAPLGDLNIRWAGRSWEAAELDTLGTDYDN